MTANKFDALTWAASDTITINGDTLKVVGVNFTKRIVYAQYDGRVIAYCFYEIEKTTAIPRKQ